MDEVKKQIALVNSKAWAVDQLAKSEFFHQKIHEWGMLSVAEAIEQLKGETFDWESNDLGISRKAWNKVIHHGIKPILVFAHPVTLCEVVGAVGYYRMLGMVSQKSMNRVRLSAAKYEVGRMAPSEHAALTIARHLNAIISILIESDDRLETREFDLWRGMAAGSQAQGSWQNAKGNRLEITIKGLFQRRVQEQGYLKGETTNGLAVQLDDARTVIFADEPDIAIYHNQQILAAVEIKGGIDTAAVLERVGAALKSLSRAKESNPSCVTILILQEVSLTARAERDLTTNRTIVNHWFTVEDVLTIEQKREELFILLNL